MFLWIIPLREKSSAEFSSVIVAKIKEIYIFSGCKCENILHELFKLFLQKKQAKPHCL